MRHFVRTVLNFMKKHGDIHDHDDAVKMLGELEDEESKSPGVQASELPQGEEAVEGVGPPTQVGATVDQAQTEPPQSELVVLVLPPKVDEDLTDPVDLVVDQAEHYEDEDEDKEKVR